MYKRVYIIAQESLVDYYLLMCDYKGTNKVL